ncbi:putative reverse transcriptase domain-containing protein [Tanacetum coccineum]
MAKPILNENMEKAQTESNLSITSNDIEIKLNKEFLMELQKNIYHRTYNEDVVDYIAKVLKMVDLIYVPGVDSHQLRMKVFPLSLADDAKEWWISEGDGKITTWEELVETFFYRFYPESYDGEDEMLDEGDKWGIDPLEFLSNMNASFKNHKKVDGRTKKSDTEKEDEQSPKKRKYRNTSNPIDEQPNKRMYKAEKSEAIKYSLGPSEEYIVIRGYEFDIWERNEDNLSITYQDIFQKKDDGWMVLRSKEISTNIGGEFTKSGDHEALIARGVVDALAEIKANRTNKNGDDNHDSGIGSRRTERAVRECNYSDSLKCQPLNFKGTEGVVGLTQWFEKMEYVFHISNGTVTCQIKFSTCTLQGKALMWWNSHIKTVGHHVAYVKTWKALKKMMTDKYCLRGEIKKLEIKLWNLKVKGTNVESYSQRFQVLALMCNRMFPKESDEIEKYNGGLPDMIHGSVMASKPKTMQDAIEFTIELIDQKIRTLAERQAENNRKFEDTSRNNQNQQQPFKRHNVAHAYTVRPGEKKPYGGSKPLCPKCNNHHDEKCAPKCTNCKRTGHSAQDCRSQPAAANNNQRAQGNRAENGNVVARAYVVGTAGKNLDANVVTGMFLLKNRYASILFDTSADRSFVSTAFSSLIDIIPTILDHGFDVELADDRIIWVNTLIRGCTLNFLNHPFNIDLIPVEMGSFDVIIGIDWLSKYHAVIVCDEKLVRVPFGNEILIFRGDRSDYGHESRLNIISCTKTQKYLLKGCPIFFAHVTTKKTENKSKEKRLKDILIV